MKKKLLTAAFALLVFFSFSESVGPGYSKALDAAYDAGVKAGQEIALKIDWSKYL